MISLSVLVVNYFFIIFMLLISRGGAVAQAATETAPNGIGVGVGISGGGGIKPPSISVSGDYTFALSSLFELGGSFDQNFIKYEDGQSGTLKFYSLMFRFRFPNFRSLFLDGKLGMTQRSQQNESTGFKFAAGVGMGYLIRLGENVDLGPRIGVRYLPNASSDFQTSQAGAIVDLGIQFSFHF
jgi:hypothetical protein